MFVRAKKKALVMKPLGTQEEEIGRWDYLFNNITYKDHLVGRDTSLKKQSVLLSHYLNSPVPVQVVEKLRI